MDAVGTASLVSTAAQESRKTCAGQRIRLSWELIGRAAVYEAKISKRGQITLPKAVREALRLQPGDRVRYFICEGKVKGLPVRPVSELCGILRHDGPPASVEEMNEAVAEAACEKHSRLMRMR